MVINKLFDSNFHNQNSPLQSSSGTISWLCREETKAKELCKNS